LSEESKRDRLDDTPSRRAEDKQVHAIDRYSPTCCEEGNWGIESVHLAQPHPDAVHLTKCIHPSAASCLLHLPTLSNCYSAGRGSHGVGNTFAVGKSPVCYTEPFMQRGLVP
jgi:hypothetical protein